MCAEQKGDICTCTGRYRCKAPSRTEKVVAVVLRLCVVVVEAGLVVFTSYRAFTWVYSFSFTVSELLFLVRRKKTLPMKKKTNEQTREEQLRRCNDTCAAQRTCIGWMMLIRRLGSFSSRRRRRRRLWLKNALKRQDPRAGECRPRNSSPALNPPSPISALSRFRLDSPEGERAHLGGLRWLCSSGTQLSWPEA